MKTLPLAFLGLSALHWVSAAADPLPAPQFIQQVDVIHFSHTDYGFTDHPAVCRDMQRRYLDLAIDAAQASANRPKGARFKWTAETTIAVNDWWQTATAERREEFLKAMRAGQIEVSALPLNNTPFLNRDQWHTMTHWLPEDLWKQLQPQTAVQNDVNGFPRAGAKELLDRGVRFLFSGINSDSGGPPLPRLTAFWWKQPDGRRLFVWLSLSYGDGFFLFDPVEWRRGPVPLAADARYRPPRPGDILKPDEASVRAAHRHCVERLKQFERDGYRYSVLPVSMTSMWRYDNDPPFAPLANFADSWNRLGLQPRLKLVTVTEAMKDLEKVAGPTAPEYAGEWTDWWANGTACAPREVAASRAAKRFLAAAQSPEKPTVNVDENGWPVSASWAGMKKPLFTSGIGDFVSVKVNANAPRWVLSDIGNTGDTAKREQLRQEKLEEVPAESGGGAVVQETPHTIRYTQPLNHPRLGWATRQLEIWKREPRARLTFRLNRLSSFAPEIFYISTPLPCDGTLPQLSSGGLPFTPFTDQLPGTCRDYFAVDGWADYAMPDGHWLWVSRDAPLITFDTPQPLARLERPPPRTGRLLAMIYNNFWYTNFLGDEPGVMEFQFDLVWRRELAGDAAALAEALMSEPVVAINPALPEQPSFLQHLYQP